ncbi:hypothetical protein EP7_002592 [Isosphaeraceae bacterium EP7]
MNYDKDDLALERQIVIKKSFSVEDRGAWTVRPVPLRYSYLGAVPLHEAMPRAEYVGEGRVLARECEIFLFRDVPWNRAKKQIVFHLDKAMSVPLKVEIFDGVSEYNGKPPLSTWVATELDQVRSRPFPIKSERATHVGRGTPNEATLRQKLTVKRIAFDQEYPRSTFWPANHPGADVVATLTNKQYEVKGKPRPVASPPAPPPIANTTTEAIRVTIPEEGVVTPSRVSIGLGVAVLVVALVLWRRR